jgi:hypothetical protein
MEGGSAGIFQRASPTGQLQECPPVIVTAPSSSRRAADPIKIGMLAPLTGPFAESRRYQTQVGETRGRRDQWGRLQCWARAAVPLDRVGTAVARQSCSRSTMSAGWPQILKQSAQPLVTHSGHEARWSRSVLRWLSGRNQK